MATRKYFVHHAVIVSKPKPKPRPDHRGKNVLVEMTPGHWQAMSSREYAMQQGRSKGGLTTQARGKAHTWTSEEATKAIKKCWKVRWGKGSRIGIRLGRPAKLRQAVDRVALRKRYDIDNTILASKDVAYSFLSNRWFRFSTQRFISERQALTVLGHLAGLSKPVPTGRVIAVQKRVKSTKESA